MIECKDINELSDYLNEVASYYRLGKENKAAWYFNMASIALEKFMCKENIQHDQHLGNLLSVMLDAQSRRDNLFFADIITYELVPHLQQLTT